MDVNKIGKRKKFIPNPHRCDGEIKPLELTGAWVYDDESVTWTGYFSGNDFIVTGYVIEHKTNYQER